MYGIGMMMGGIPVCLQNVGNNVHNGALCERFSCKKGILTQPGSDVADVSHL